MAFTITQFGYLKNRLAELLGDAQKIFWTDAELGLYLHEALTVFQSLAHYWRKTGEFTATPGQRWIKLSNVLRDANGEYLLRSQISDRNILQQILYSLLEQQPVSWAAWGLSEQFSQAEIEAALNRTIAKFQLLTESYLVNTTTAISPTVGLYDLNERTIGLVSAAVVTPENTRYPLWRETRREYQLNEQAFLPETPAFPRSYTWLEEDTLHLRLNPTPNDIGTLELITAQVSAPLTPATTTTLLPIPPNLWWVIKYGTLMDLLSRDGEGQDWARAAYCHQRWEDGLALARYMMPSILRVWKNDLEIQVSPLQEIEAWNPTWANTVGDPRTLVMAGWDLAAFSPAIDAADTETYNIRMQSVQRIELPQSDSEVVTLGEEYMTSLLAYARHAALLKTSGAEFQQSVPAYQELFDAAASYNEQLKKQQRMFSFYSQHSTRDRKGAFGLRDNDGDKD